MTFKMTDLPRKERPRERLIAQGAETLSTQELLAVILGSGTAALPVSRTASTLLSRFGSLKKLAQASYEELTDIKGMGPAKAASLLACFALACRAEGPERLPRIITKAEDAYKVLFPLLSDKDKEHFALLCLDTQHRVINVKVISVGTINASLVHPRDIFHTAVKSLACCVILGHNHPSGETLPSPTDRAVTKRIIESGKILGITILDHIIIGRNRFFSMKDNNMLS